MSAIVQLKHIFGYRTGTSRSVAYHDEQTAVFPGGSNLVIHNMDNMVQKFMNGHEKSSSITAMAISPNRRYVSLAEQTPDKPIVVIYDIQACIRKKILWSPDVRSNEYISIAFSSDSKYLAAQGGLPDWQLIYWSWEKGSGVFRRYRYSDNVLKPYGYTRVPLLNFLCHTWISSERLAIGTDNAICYILQNGDVISEIDVKLIPPVEALIHQGDPKEADDLSCEIKQYISALASSGENLFIACFPGTVHRFKAINDLPTKTTGRRYVGSRHKKDTYELESTIIIPIDPTSSTENDPLSRQEITHMSISPNAHNLLACTDAHQLYRASLEPTDQKSVGRQPGQNVRHLVTEKQTEAVTKIGSFMPIAQIFHNGHILGLDVCVRKPLIATCSTDRSVRIWNFRTNALELAKQFAEESYSIALHPTGLYALVGFSDKLRLMNILIDDMRTYHEFPIRGCQECSFSNGGHLLAAVSGNLIQIYSMISFENVASLKGHNGKIRCLVWTDDDSKLISCGMDGAVYEWDPVKGVRTAEIVLKSCSYSSVSVSSDAKTILAVGSDKSLKEISNSQVVRDVPSPDHLLTTVALSRSGRMLFCGTETGTVRSYEFPLADHLSWQNYVGHCAPITKMKIAAKDEILVTGSDDCCVMVWQIEDRDTTRGGRGEKVDAWSQEILIPKSDLEEKNLLVEEMKTRVDELKMDGEYQMKLKDIAYNERIKDLTEKFVQEMESLRKKIEIIETEKDLDRLHTEKKFRETVDLHTKELQEFEAKTTSALQEERDKVTEARKELERQKSEYEEKLCANERVQKDMLEDLKKDHQVQIGEQELIVENLKREIRDQNMENEVTKRLIEEDADREILETKIRYEKRLREERETNARLKGESGIMKKKLTSLQKEIDEHKEEIRGFNVEIQKLNGVIRNLEKDIQGLRKEIRERDDTIQDKEKRIYDLKKKNQELEKFRFVLDYKNNELKKQIEPRENDIKNYKEQIQEMEIELEQFQRQNDQLEVNIAQMNQKHKTVAKELNHEVETNRNIRATIKHFKTDLFNCVRDIQEPKLLKSNIMQLYKKYIQDEMNTDSRKTDNDATNTDIQQEFSRQRQYLERSILGLRKKLTNDSEGNRASYVTIMKENVNLMTQVNELRHELGIARDKIAKLNAALGVNRRNNEGARGLINIVEKGKQNIVLEENLQMSHKVLNEQQKLIIKLQDRLANVAAESCTEEWDQSERFLPMDSSRNKSDTTLTVPALPPIHVVSEKEQDSQ